MTTTLTAPRSTSTDFTIKHNTYSDGAPYFTIQCVTTAGTSDVKDSTGYIRRFSTRSSARKAITRLRRSL